jgi:hypothetical protein
MRVQPLEFTRHGAISSRSRSVRDMRVRAEGKFRQRVDGELMHPPGNAWSTL